MARVTFKPRWLRVSATIGMGAVAPLSAQTATAKSLYVSCAPTSVWHADLEKDGNWGPKFSVRIDSEAMWWWRPEKRQWITLSRCASNPLPRTTAACSMTLSDGEAIFDSKTYWDSGRTTSGRFRVSRVTGKYRYDSYDQDQKLGWEESGVCTAETNPESIPTERAF